MPVTFQPSANAATSSSWRTRRSPQVSRLTVAEAHQVAAVPRPQHHRQAGDVPGAILVVEDVEEPAVDDHVEGHGEMAEVQRAGDLESGRHVSCGLPAYLLNGARRHVDALGIRTVGASQSVAASSSRSSAPLESWSPARHTTHVDSRSRATTPTTSIEPSSRPDLRSVELEAAVGAGSCWSAGGFAHS
jgi:hypothetical protein